MAVRDVLIVGGGPSGLATAIAAKHAGLDYVVIEKGVLVDSIFRFPTFMVFFTTPELLEIGALPLTTPYDKPTRLEALRYYRKVVDTYQLQISLHEQVVEIQPPSPSATARQGLPSASATARQGLPPASAGEGQPFIVTTESKGVRRVREAKAVVLAIGYFDRPNYLGVPGEDLPHVSHYYTDAHPYYRQRVVVVGGKNGAAEAALELFRGGAHVTLVHRREALGDSIKYWVRPDIENRIKEGSIAARFNTRVVEIKPGVVVVAPTGVESQGKVDEISADGVFLLTGYHADVDLLRGAGISCDADTLKPELNPETFETNVPGLFLAGGAIAGRQTGSIFIENGRFHGEKIIKVLADRLRGAE